MWHILKTNHLDPEIPQEAVSTEFPDFLITILAGKFEECCSEIRSKELNWTLWFLHT